MHTPIRSSPAFQAFDSYDALAKALRNRFPDADWPTDRSLGTLIGKIDRGNSVWWAKRPDLAKALADLLELSLEDLGAYEQKAKLSFQFEAFPGLQPLNLKREAPCRLATPRFLGSSQFRQTLDQWLDPQAFQRSGTETEWLQISDELEHQLLTQWLDAAGRYKVIFVEHLADAADHMEELAPLVISVSADADEADLRVLAKRPDGWGVLVISPFMPRPQLETSSAAFMGWEFISLRGTERNQVERNFGNFRRWSWDLLPDWRRRLLEWVEVRLNRYGTDTLFSATGVSDWLEQFDPLEKWFSTTSDVLQLCQIAHQVSERRLPKPNSLESGNRMTQAIFGQASPTKIVSIKQLAEARWNRLDLPWRGDLPLESWLSLAIPSVPRITKEDVQAIAHGSIGERNSNARRVANLLEAGNPDALLSTGLLKKGHRNKFDFQHGTLARLLVRDLLMRKIAREDLGTWALACFDESRRSTVDAALDALSTDHLVTVAERLRQAPNDSAVALAASEALFLAVGRRLIEGQKIPTALGTIAQCVSSRLDLSDSLSPLDPWSRSTDSSDEQLEWIAACWAWSLMTDVPIGIADSWLFPSSSRSGPNSALWPRIPVWKNIEWPKDNCEQLPRVMEGLLFCTCLWLKDIENPDLTFLDGPESVFPRIAILERAARGGCNAESEWWNEVIARRWAANALLDKLIGVGNAAAARLWPSLLAFALQPSQDGYRIRWSPIWIGILEQLTPREALDGLDRQALVHLGSIPEALPPSYRAPLLQHLSTEQHLADYSEVDEFIERFGPAAVPALPSVLDHVELGRTAARYLWRWDPEAAERLLQRNDDLNVLARENLLDECPAEYLPSAIDVLASNPNLLEPDQRVYWARRHLPHSSGQAELLLSMIKSNS